MKKTLLIALCAAFCLALCGCDEGNNTSDNMNSSSSQNAEGPSGPAGGSDGDETLSVKEKTDKLLAEVKFPSMIEVEADELNTLLGIDKDDVSEFAAYTCPSGAAPDEFGIFVAKDAEAAARIKDALDKRVQSQYNTFESYTPGAMYRFDDDFVEVNGTTVIYAICDNNETAKEILK
ncbi:MAG: DUF4358 domain-containing protein [Oscillospiraceae bacterium]|nr:DUF4358 domain-containing protein [Oscillospiraceae bacterium]